MTPSDIKKILTHLKKNNVQSFKSGDIEIHFYESPQVIRQKRAKAAQESAETAKNLAETIKQQEMNMPPDLRADDLMNVDKILHWSGSPDTSDPLALTGEQAL